MDFKSPIEALHLLGLDEYATKDDIRAAYRKLAAKYHPDANISGGDETNDYFIKIGEAYEYLINAYDAAYAEYIRASYRPAEPRIIGNQTAMQEQAEYHYRNEQKLKQERRLDRQRKQRKEEREKKFSYYKEQTEYEEAMLKIHAIRAAEVSMNILEAMLQGKI